MSHMFVGMQGPDEIFDDVLWEYMGIIKHYSSYHSISHMMRLPGTQQKATVMLQPAMALGPGLRVSQSRSFPL